MTAFSLVIWRWKEHDLSQYEQAELRQLGKYEAQSTISLKLWWKRRVRRKKGLSSRFRLYHNLEGKKARVLKIGKTYLYFFLGWLEIKFLKIHWSSFLFASSCSNNGNFKNLYMPYRFISWINSYMVFHIYFPSPWTAFQFETGTRMSNVETDLN